MFQFPGFASLTYVFSQGYLERWVSPFGNPRIKASLQAPRGISHATTSFIASYCLGIHRMRLFTWPYNPKQSVYARSCFRSLRCRSLWKMGSETKFSVPTFTWKTAPEKIRLWPHFSSHSRALCSKPISSPKPDEQVSMVADSWCNIPVIRFMRTRKNLITLLIRLDNRSIWSCAFNNFPNF